MQFFDPKNPNEKKKMIAAAVLALVAIVVLGLRFFWWRIVDPAEERCGNQTLAFTQGGQNLQI